MEVDPRTASFGCICPSCQQVVQVPRMAVPIAASRASGAVAPPAAPRPKKKPAPPPAWLTPTLIGAGVCAVVLAGAWIVKNSQPPDRRETADDAFLKTQASMQSVLAEDQKRAAEKLRREEEDRRRAEEQRRLAPYNEARQYAEQFNSYRDFYRDLILASSPDASPALVDAMLDCMAKAWKDVLALYTDRIEGNEPGDNHAAFDEFTRQRMLRDPRLLAAIPKMFGPGPRSRPAPPLAAEPAVLKDYPRSGTGFFIGREGWIVTAKHVVEGSTRVDVLRGKEEKITAKVEAMDPKLDVALLKADTTSEIWIPLSEARKDKVPLGRPVLTVGFPRPKIQGLAAKLGNGRISSLEGMVDDPDSFQFSVPDIGPGNSGGPMVDSSTGWALGVVTSLLRNAGATNYALQSGAHASRRWCLPCRT